MGLPLGGAGAHCAPSLRLGCSLQAFSFAHWPLRRANFAGRAGFRAKVRKCIRLTGVESDYTKANNPFCVFAGCAP
jgi:hypothetical protein